MSIAAPLVWLAMILAAGASAWASPGGAAPAPATKHADPFAENACVQCHRDLPGRLGEIVHLEWGQSVHQRAQVGCDGCHGGNPSARREQFDSTEAWTKASHMDRNPEFLLLHQGSQVISAARGRSVSYFCGKCHSKIKELHLGSPHGEFGEPTCLYCHGRGSHMITKPSPAIIDTRSRTEEGRCSRCHRAATMEVVSRVKKLLTETEDQIKTSGQQYAEMEGWGYKNLELEKLNHHAAEVRSQLRQTFHSFNMRDINNFAGEIQGAVDRTGATHDMVVRLRKTQQEQARMGMAAVGLLLAFAAMLLYYKKAFLPKHARPQRGSIDPPDPEHAAAGSLLFGVQPSGCEKLTKTS